MQVQTTINKRESRDSQSLLTLTTITESSAMIFIDSSTTKRKCGRKALTQEQFVLKASIQHNYRYSYNKTVFRNTRSKVIITCSLHGDFEQKAQNHLNGNGCPKCFLLIDNVNRQKKTTAEFISESQEKYGDLFLYDKTLYVNNKTKVIVTCRIHGDFEQEASSHLRGGGCPKCAYERIAKSRNVSNQETKWLASLNIADLESGYLIFSEKHNRKFVVDGYDKSTNTVYLYHGDYWHGNIKKYDRTLVNTIVGKTMGELYDATVEYENQLRELNYNVVTMWESDWKRT